MLFQYEFPLGGIRSLILQQLRGCQASSEQVEKSGGQELISAVAQALISGCRVPLVVLETMATQATCLYHCIAPAYALTAFRLPLE
jgi:hypothetical protein